MKKIVKRHPPTELQQWRANNSATPENIRYNKANFPRDEVLHSLLLEQGYLCAYTLLSINESKAHIEHLKPQSICRQEDEKLESKGKNRKHEDVEWRNLVACFPQPLAEHPRYGAWQKDNWWCNENFLSPIAENCENRFRYYNDGSIKPAVDSDVPAKTTIDSLKLNCDRLKELRKQAIKANGFHKQSRHPIMSISAIEKKITQLRQVQSEKYIEFCTAIEQVGEFYIEDLKKLASRKRHRAKATKD